LDISAGVKTVANIGHRVADIQVPQKYYFGNIPAKNIGPGIFEYSGYWLLVGSEGLADNLPCV
jgi:hypothetical protein